MIATEKLWKKITVIQLGSRHWEMVRKMACWGIFGCADRRKRKGQENTSQGLTQLHWMSSTGNEEANINWDLGTCNRMNIQYWRIAEAGCSIPKRTSGVIIKRSRCAITLMCPFLHTICLDRVLSNDRWSQVSRVIPHGRGYIILCMLSLSLSLSLYTDTVSL